MRKKIVGIFVMTLLIAATVMPVVATMNELKDSGVSSLDGPTVEWSKTFGGEEFDMFYDVKTTDDGGFIACGVIEDSDNYNAWVMKTDSNGNEEWSVINNDINGTLVTSARMDVNCYFILETSDEGYIIVGCSMAFLEYEGESGWINTGYAWKIDDAGSTEWIQRFYSFEEYSVDFPWCIKEIDDGYVLSGWKIFYDPEDFSVTDMNGYLTKIDFNGDPVWQKSYDLGAIDHLSSVCQTSDGGYLLTGDTGDDTTWGSLWMIKTDNAGNKQWEKIFDGPEFEWSFARYACETSDDGYIMVGVTSSYGEGGNDVWIIKTDSSGNIDWDKTYGGSGHEYCWSMDETPDGGYIFAAKKSKFGGTKDDSWVLKTDKDGNTIWSFIIEEDEIQSPHTIRSTDDGGAILSGHSGGTMGNPNADALLVKVAPFENERPEKSEIDGPSKGKPDKEYTFTASSSDDDGDSLTYMWDWGDGNFSDWLDDNEATYTWSYEANFEVRVIVKDEHGGESEWSDPLAFSTPRHKDISQYNILFWRILERFTFLKSPF